MHSDFKKYFFWRMISAVGDEIWAVSIPVILASVLKINEIGQVYSFGAVGTLLGFFLATWVGTKFNEIIGSLYCDIIQSFIFFVLAIIMIFDFKIATLFWFAIFFVVGFISAVWFALSESMISHFNFNNSNNQSLHKWNYLAGTAGPILGPVFGGILISVGSFFLLPLFNAISFFGQAYQIRAISSNQGSEYKTQANKNDWFYKLKDGVGIIFKDARMRGLTAIPVIVKISLVGLLPFISVKIIKSGYSAWIATSIIYFFSVGSLLGGLSFGNPKLRLINFSFSINVFSMIIAIVTLALLYTQTTSYLSLFIIAMLLAGFFSSQYTIQLRNMRQQIVPPHLLSSVISGQSLLVRVATPISGLLFGQLIFSNQNLVILIYIVLITIALYGIVSVKIKCTEEELKN